MCATSVWSTIYEFLRFRAEQSADAVAILAPGRLPLTYKELLNQVERTAATLKAGGITAHDRIGIVIPGGPELATAFLSVASVATAIPLNPAYRENEFDFFVSDLRPKALIVAAPTEGPAVTVAKRLGVETVSLHPRLDAAAGVFSLNGSRMVGSNSHSGTHHDHIALVLHTSGTTSKPKRVPLTHRNLLAAAENIASWLGLTATDRCLNIMPLYHIHGLVGGLLASLTAGGSVAVPPEFSASSFCGWLHDLKPSWYTAVPTMHQAILRNSAGRTPGRGAHSLRFIRSCSAPLPPPLMSELEAVFDVPVVEAYGMTEASHQIASNPLPPLQRKPGSVGVPTGTEVAVMSEAGHLMPVGDVGEIVLRGPSVTSGYDENSEANEQAFAHGWFRTGDQGFIDANGYLFLTGRIKELINRGGTKVSPLEIEEALLAHPAISEAAAFPVNHSTLGEDVAAAVVLKPDHEITDWEIRQFAAGRLADFKVPQHIVLVDTIPRSQTGKVQRSHLAGQLGLNRVTAIRQVMAERRTEFEAKVASTWCATLKLESISIHDNFFVLGGDSITAAEVASRLSDVLSIDLPLISFVDTPTVAGMARRIASRLAATDSQAVALRTERPQFESLVELQRGSHGKPIFLFPGGGGDDSEFFAFMPLVRWMPPSYRIYGFRARGATEFGESHSSVDEMVQDYLAEILRIEPEGPYFLIGDCIGGAVACETARLLKAAGREIATLIVLDGENPTTMKYWRYRLEGLRQSIATGVLDRWKTTQQKVREVFDGTRAVVGPRADRRGTSGGGSKGNERVHDIINPVSRIDAASEVHRRNLRRYHSKPYDGEIKLVVNQQWFKRSPTLGWERVAAGVESWVATGHHFTYRVGSQHAKNVAQRLVKWIDAARGGNDRDWRPEGMDESRQSTEVPLFLRELLTNAKAAVADLIPVGDKVIVVDDGQWEGTFLAGRVAVPFLERDGQYYGCPPDSETAVRELERLRIAGAHFIVFGSPSFWWLNYYVGFRDFLQARFDCILRNECMIVFDLQTATQPATSVDNRPDRSM
jgi:acyl-CoA synthetase (AMP-forming)/AMP-acid ligase II/thioesterase domain-containing protein/acyl carrier protein